MVSLWVGKGVVVVWIGGVVEGFAVVIVTVIGSVVVVVAVAVAVAVG